MTSKLKVNLINDSGDNNVITSDGSGKITASKFSYGQVAMNTADLNITIGSTSYAEISTDLRLTLTPNSTSSKFIYSLNGTVFTNNNKIC